MSLKKKYILTDKLLSLSNDISLPRDAKTIGFSKYKSARKTFQDMSRKIIWSMDEGRYEDANNLLKHFNSRKNKDMATVLEIYMFTSVKGFKHVITEHKVTLRDEEYKDEYGHSVVEAKDLLSIGGLYGGIECEKPTLHSYTFCLAKDKETAIANLKAEIIERFEELEAGLKYLKDCIQ